jgi:hypothetical protein
VRLSPLPGAPLGHTKAELDERIQVLIVVLSSELREAIHRNAVEALYQLMA